MTETNTRGEKHLGKNEQELLKRFKIKYPAYTTNLRADYILLPQLGLVDSEFNNYAKNWNTLTAPRIDAVASLPGDKPIIYEIRPKADWTAISAVIAYRELFRQIYSYTWEIKLGIICESMSKTNRAICKMFGVAIFEV